MQFTVEDYLKAKRFGLRHAGRTLGEKSVDSYRVVCRIAESCVGKPITTFTEDDVDELLCIAQARGLAVSTINAMLTVGRGLWRWGIASGLAPTDRNPFENVVARPVKEKVPEILSEEEVQRIIKKLYAEEKRRHGKNWSLATSYVHKYVLMIKLMYYGGLRSEEARSLRRKDVHRDGVVIRGKGGNEYFVPLTEELCQELLTYIAEHPAETYVFVRETDYEYWGRDNSEKPLSRTAIYHALAQGAKLAGIKRRISPHSLRHSFATIVLERTGNLALTQDLMRHRDPRTTRRYAQIRKPYLLEAYRKLWC